MAISDAVRLHGPPPYHESMLSLRRTSYEPRIEIMPLIDVIFLLLTFFIYAMVLMVRAELMPMELQQYASAEPAPPQPSVTVSIMLDGSVFVNRQPVELDDVRDRIEQLLTEAESNRVDLALADGPGTVDRAPIITRLLDDLQDAGLEIFFMGQRAEASSDAARTPAPPQP